MVKFIYISLIYCLLISLADGSELFHRFHKTYAVSSKKSSSRTISVGLVLVDLPTYRVIEPTNLIYSQVLSHSKTAPFGDDHGRSTNVHETVHGINNQLRNHYKQTLKKNINGFYAGDGKGVIILNPNITMRDIIPYIPSVVRGYRYKLYFIDQIGAWNDVPTYPMDEWTAYIAGAECAVDDRSHKIILEKSDYVSGSLEFSIYCTALCMAVADRDREYWSDNEQFKNAIQYFLIKSEKIFFEGRDHFPSQQQDKLLDALRNHDDTKDMRTFLLNEFQGVFVD